jgi:DNA-binding protein Fis
MNHYKGNQSRAAKALNLARGTLRAKLNQHFETTKVGKQANE